MQLFGWLEVAKKQT